MSCRNTKSSELPTHKAAELAAIDFKFNAKRCHSENGEFVGPRWIPDDERSVCSGCNTSFDWMNRRHHCRHCGDIFCHKCSDNRMLLPSQFSIHDLERVCNSCAKVLAPQQGKLIKDIANHSRVNNVDITSTIRHLNLPLSKTLGSELRKATYSIYNMFHVHLIQDSSVPLSLLRGARGLAFITVLKGGFVFAPRFGTGLVISRLPSGKWSAPTAIASIGLSWGALVGVDVTDYVVVLHDVQAVRAFTSPGQVSVGGEVKVSVAGMGRTGAGELIVGERGMATALSYCHSRGLYAGLSLDGSILFSRSDVNLNFYGRNVTPFELLSGAVEPPVAARCLYDSLDYVMQLSGESIEDYAVKEQPRPTSSQLAARELAEARKSFKKVNT